MNDKFDFESLTQTWNEQSTGTSFDAVKLKKRLFIQRLGLLALSLSELLILAAVIWALLAAFEHSWPMISKVWLIFGLISGVSITIPVMKSRFTSYKMLDLATRDWLKLQIRLSKEALFRGRLTRYLILAFSLALGLFLIYEVSLHQFDLPRLALRYAFGIFWLLMAWIINQRQAKKHLAFLKDNPDNGE